MTMPVLLAADDDDDVLSAITRDLRKHYARDYRVLRAERLAEELGGTRTADR